MRNQNKIDMNGNLFLRSSWKKMINREKKNNYSKNETRKDLYDSLRKLENELLVRQWASYFLREVRANSQNGFKELNYQEQEKTIFQSLQEVASVLGADDLYYSRRKMKYNNSSSSMSLRKDLTGFIYRAYLRNSRLD